MRDVSQLSAMHAVVILSSMRKRGLLRTKIILPDFIPSSLVANRSRIENVHVFIASSLDHLDYL